MTHSKIKFIAPERIFSNHKAEYLEVTESSLMHGVVIGGIAESIFESSIAKISNRRFAITVSSCTDALFFILTAIGIGSCDEVITTSYSFIATASAILRTGARPVFVDIDYYYHLDINEIKQSITKRTKAVIVVNLFGDCVNYIEFEDLCAQYNILLIEDAAQSFGAKFCGVPSGKFGVASAFSFSPMKPVPCFGTGGAIVTDSEVIAEKCRLLRRHGKKGGFVDHLGYNSVIASDKLAQLNVSLKYMENWQTMRNHIANEYEVAFRETTEVETPKVRPGSTHCWHKYVLKTRYRNELKEYLDRYNVESQVHYINPLPTEPLFSLCRHDGYVNAESCSKANLSLPIYPYLSSDELTHVVTTVKSFYARL